MNERTGKSDHLRFRQGEQLRGQTAVVTGASRGIGRAIALELAAAGADVLIHTRANRPMAEGVRNSVREMRQDAEVYAADLSDPASVPKLADAAWDWKNGIDIWVNNAGADNVLTGEAANWTFDEKLQHLFQVDVMAAIQLSRTIGQRMKQRGGGAGRSAILNMGWDQAQHGMEGDSGELFATTKGAMMAFTRSLAKSLAPEVRVNCLAPGWIKTAWGEGTSQYWQQRACRESLLGRWGTPEDVARVACFLVSPAAGFLNGQIVPINGGFRTSDS